ncbi:MAG: T9SS type A sorting domain-containing protein, partial [Bacteroidales bacterium]|nr:T9SS type A sorting domain-containing protein [Bacteroidales bacterium]
IIGGDLEIGTNYSLLNINDLSNISHIAGDLIVSKNSSITSLSGLNNIEPASIEDLDIHYNSSLSTCDVESICNYLVSPNGEVEIYGNAPGCNSIEEVQAACDTLSVQEIILEENFSISPNPCSGSLNLNFTIIQQGVVNCDLFEISGIEVKRLLNEPKKPGTYDVVFNVSDLPAGVYIIKLQTKNKIDMKKIIKR